MSASEPWRGRGGSRHIGRTRVACAEILSKYLGKEIRPEEVYPATGRHRTDWRQDVYRWEVSCIRYNLGIALGCWERMTDFVRQAKRRGMHISGDVIYPGPDPDKIKSEG